MHKTFPLVLALTALAPAGVLAQGLTPQQVMQLDHVVEALPSPDGSHIAYVVRRQRSSEEGAGGSNATAWLVPVDGSTAPRELPTAGGLAWHPDGERITFLGRSSADPSTQVFAISLNGGAVDQITSIDGGLRSYQWRPDGGALAFTRMDPFPEAQAAARERGFEVEVVDEDWRDISLWHWNAASGAVKRLTQGSTVQSFVWSPDGERIAAGLSPRNLTDDHYMFTRIWEVVPESGEVSLLVDNPGKLSTAAWSPDGTQLAFVGAWDRRDPHAGSLFVVDRQSREVTPITEGFAGMVHEPVWRSDHVLDALCSVGVFHELRTFDLNDVTRAADGSTVSPQMVLSERVPQGDHLHRLGDDGWVMAASTPSHPAEVFVKADRTASWQQLTHHNTWLSDVKLGRQQVVRFDARDGLEIEGMLIHPVDAAPATRTALVIVAHGGPESHYSNAWITRYSEPGQVLAGMGYTVWYPNYRASTGYGVDFAKADHGDPMGSEFDDHLDAIAHFAGRGLIDPDRVGVIGGSYGGYTAAWAATRHTRHFKAAVSFVPFVDIRTKWLTSDIPYEFYHVHYQEKWPHEQTGFLADRSPLTWAHQCETPLLLCGGDADPRVHPSQPFMLYRAVKFSTETPTRYIRYPGEGHGNARNVYRYDYMLRGIRWLDHYLQPGATRSTPMPPRDIEYPKW